MGQDDLDLRTDDTAAQPETGTALVKREAPGPPLVVVQYRRNWSATLLPPVLIVLVALALLKVRVEYPDWGAVRSPRSEPVPSSAEAHPRGPTPLVEPDRLVARAEGDPAPLGPPNPTEPVPPEAEVIAGEPQPGAEPAGPARSSEPKLALGFVPPLQAAAGTSPAPMVVENVSPFDLTVPRGAAVGAVAGPVPAPPPPPAGEADGADVAAESRQIREERDRLEGLKDTLLEMDRKEAGTKKMEEARQVLQRIETSRATYLGELSQILRRQGADAGPSILSLSERYGRTVPELAVARAQKILSGPTAGRMDFKTKVEKLRAVGWPEPMILDELARGEVRTIGSRRGPQNRGEALVVAARKLLLVPLATPGPNAARAPSRDARRPMQ